ncbi:hypothetical protein HHK36_027971 [Tetracentron sinense]|uniref:MSP domain-containing protein n=1 Tax=Tetracentron sinense TaxID=13715 RepID=A0A834YIN1_TETSI|nr:hypothetical protein HHK36_027971 [Tetracentron sinense]
MSSGDLLNIHPTELKFPFELNKQSSCSLQLTNKSDQYVAFKVKTTNPKKYCVRPNTGIVSPGTTCDVTVTMQAQNEAPPDMHSKDKFLLQSVAAPNGAIAKEITAELFNKEAGKVVEEFKFRVVFIPANPPSPVPEGSEEGNSPRASGLDNGNQNSVLFDAVSVSCGFRSSIPKAVARSSEEPKEESSEVIPFTFEVFNHMLNALSMISKLTEEKTSAIQQTQKLRQELLLIPSSISLCEIDLLMCTLVLFLP